MDWDTGDRSPSIMSRKRGERRSHAPVMVQEVLTWLQADRWGIFVDGTIGSGGHAKAILDHSAPRGSLVGIDWDPEALERARENLRHCEDRLWLQEGNYKDMGRILQRLGIHQVNGILLDLGASWEQLTCGHRGFSLMAPGPLDMRFNPMTPMTAERIVNHWPQERLQALFRRCGEERWAARVARAIVRSRPLTSTKDLADLVARVVPGRPRRLHPATRVFQALRIEVNSELQNVEQGLREAARCLAPGARLCVISYHSLEDGLTKRVFRELSAPTMGGVFCVLNVKPIMATREEVDKNPSARGAKLRVLQRVG
ncbi:MAG: 16S rRNA (cytosine(1402)-N(4))-methyltransferase RsmH [Thermodesulfobacteriota bacterium]